MTTEKRKEQLRAAQRRKRNQRKEAGLVRIEAWIKEEKKDEAIQLINDLNNRKPDDG